VPQVPEVSGADAIRELAGALERYQSLFAITGDAVALYSRDGTIVAGNDTARALIGGRLLGSHFSRHLAQGERALAEAHFKAALSGEPAEFESIFTSRGGEALDVAVRLTPARVAGKIVGVFGAARDITQRRRAEAGRDESREQFRSLFELHPDSISIVDAAGRYERINAAAERMLGYRSEDVAGKKVGMVFPAADPDELDRFVHSLTYAGKPRRYTREFVRKDGTPIVIEGTAVPIVVNGKVTGLFLMSRDITGRARITEARAQQARRARALYRLASKIGAEPEEQTESALAFGLKELGFDSAFIVTAAGESIALERTVGAALPADSGDPLLRQLIRETLAGSALLEAGDAALSLRAQPGRPAAFCRSFVGIPLEDESGRRAALCFASLLPTAPLTDFDREFVRAVAELAAVSIERAVEEKHLYGLAHIDALTGLPNRLSLSDRFKQAIAIAERRGEQVAVSFIDIDKFKTINDTYGHQTGDEVLREVAKRLRKAARETDTVARLAGDEFIVLQPGLTSGARPEALASRIRTEFAAPWEIAGMHLKVSACIGISLFPQDGKDERSLVESADVALYAAKACGDGSFRRYGFATEIGASPAASLERRNRHLAAESLELSRPELATIQTFS
jgi:diguanylate cyclase (GGDEF)-like protein/PAS domain S-box-containing protein